MLRASLVYRTTQAPLHADFSSALEVCYSLSQTDIAEMSLEAGFGPLIQVVFPILGYLGTFVGIVFIAWRIRWSRLIRGEKERRNRIRQLTHLYIHPNIAVDSTMELNHELEGSGANSEKLFATVAQEERRKLDPDATLHKEDR